ncbi:MAG: hypothetical protein FJ290_07760 [Planctomycetes bacterium]|nr:hypothetical protein [Planctomycetota bacterium]
MSQTALRRILGGLLAACLPVALGLVSCTPEERHRALTFFFDGVPPLHPEADSVKLVPESKRAAPVTPGPARPTPSVVAGYEHKPGLDRTQCGACHNVNRSYRLLKPIGELCSSCHEREMREFPRMHGPVALGDCAACHEAHRSRYKHLVKAPAPTLCFRCHEQTPEGAKPPACPRASDDVNCLKCHDAHGSADPAFLTRRAAAQRQGALPSPPGGAP